MRLATLAASNALCATCGEARRDRSIRSFPSTTSRWCLWGRAGARLPCEVSPFARGAHSVPNLPTRGSSWTSRPSTERTWVRGYGGTYRSPPCGYSTTRRREQTRDPEHRPLSRSGQSGSRWSAGAEVNVRLSLRSIAFPLSISLLISLPLIASVIVVRHLSSPMLFRSPRIMMHVFFAPRLFLHPLNSLSYGYPCLFVPSSTLHYRTSRRLRRFFLPPPPFPSRFYSVLYAFMAIAPARESWVYLYMQLCYTEPLTGGWYLLEVIFSAVCNLSEEERS